MALGNDSSLSGDPPPSTQERSERSGQASAQHTAHGKGSLLDGPAAVTFAYVNGDNLVHLKALNRAIFPVPYKDKFYHDCCAFQEVRAATRRPRKLPLNPSPGNNPAP